MNQEKKEIGKIIWFKNQFGFISREGKEDLFVHYSDIVSEGYKTLYKGQIVSFEVGLNKKGQPKAINVVVLPQ
jgi:CspA family cold shock protein